MEYISSDTNIWIDFFAIGHTELPFLLPYIYLMNQEAIDCELLEPPGIGERLVSLGLRGTELITEEFYLAAELAKKYRRLSLYDSIALAIAKMRGIVLMTGDNALRKAARSENVEVIGTIGILDQLLSYGCIGKQLYGDCIKALMECNGRQVRLPVDELKKRLL